MEPEDWIKQFAEQLGQKPPSPEEVEILLELAGVAAHASARTAAPIACWLVGRAGYSATDALAEAERV